MSSTPAAVVDERPVTAGTSTQVANPTRTTIRTFVQSAIGLLVVLVPLVNLTLISVQAFLTEQTTIVLPGWVYLLVNVGIAITTFVIALVARIMAVPGVAAFIQVRLPWLAPIRPVTSGLQSALPVDRTTILP